MMHAVAVVVPAAAACCSLDVSRSVMGILVGMGRRSAVDVLVMDGPIPAGADKVIGELVHFGGGKGIEVNRGHGVASAYGAMTLCRMLLQAAGDAWRRWMQLAAD